MIWHKHAMIDNNNKDRNMNNVRCFKDTSNEYLDGIKQETNKSIVNVCNLVGKWLNETKMSEKSKFSCLLPNGKKLESQDDSDEESEDSKNNDARQMVVVRNLKLILKVNMDIVVWKDLEKDYEY